MAPNSNKATPAGVKAAKHAASPSAQPAGKYSAGKGAKADVAPKQKGDKHAEAAAPIKGKNGKSMKA